MNRTHYKTAHGKRACKKKGTQTKRERNATEKQICFSGACVDCWDCQYWLAANNPALATQNGTNLRLRRNREQAEAQARKSPTEFV